MINRARISKNILANFLLPLVVCLVLCILSYLLFRLNIKLATIIQIILTVLTLALALISAGALKETRELKYESARPLIIFEHCSIYPEPPPPPLTHDEATRARFRRIRNDFDKDQGIAREKEVTDNKEVSDGQDITDNKMVLDYRIKNLGAGIATNIFIKLVNKKGKDIASRFHIRLANNQYEPLETVLSKFTNTSPVPVEYGGGWATPVGRAEDYLIEGRMNFQLNINNIELHLDYCCIYGRQYRTIYEYDFENRVLTNERFIAK